MEGVGDVRMLAIGDINTSAVLGFTSQETINNVKLLTVNSRTVEIMLLPFDQNQQGAAVTSFYMLDTLAVIIFLDCQTLKSGFDAAMKGVQERQEQILDERKLRGENADIYWFVCLYQLDAPVDNTDLLMKIVAYRAEKQS